MPRGGRVVACVILEGGGVGWPIPSPSTPTLAEEQLRLQRGWGMGGQSFAKEEAGILVGNHSNEAMKPEPGLRTNWPDLAWGEGSTRGVEEVGPWLSGRGWTDSRRVFPRDQAVMGRGAAVPLLSPGCPLGRLPERREESGAPATQAACPVAKVSSPSVTLSGCSCNPATSLPV